MLVAVALSLGVGAVAAPAASAWPWDPPKPTACDKAVKTFSYGVLTPRDLPDDVSPCLKNDLGKKLLADKKTVLNALKAEKAAKKSASKAKTKKQKAHYEALAKQSRATVKKLVLRDWQVLTATMHKNYGEAIMGYVDERLRLDDEGVKFHYRAMLNYAAYELNRSNKINVAYKALNQAAKIFPKNWVKKAKNKDVAKKVSDAIAKKLEVTPVALILQTEGHVQRWASSNSTFLLHGVFSQW